MFNPVATYRLQFHKEFTFEAFARIIPYLRKLGITTVYASPIFEATPGSTHGYDGTDPHNINPEIGNEEQLRNISSKLKAEGISWLQDIVPNHMAYHPNNKWLMDMLEKGPKSFFARFFDNSWNTGNSNDRIMVPFLGSSLEEVISNDELKVAFENGQLVFKYYDSAYPLRLKSYETILRGKEMPEEMWRMVIQTENAEENINTREDLKSRLIDLFNHDTYKQHLQDRIEEINQDHFRIRELADEQYYRLCHWQETDTQINFRRFFTINGLICLNIQDSEVFEYFHKKIKEFVNGGIFQGLRIDHIDGLYDPSVYLEELRNLAGEETYITVEKILQPDESVPSIWPIQGNTGYDFLAIVNNLFTNRSSEEDFTRYYNALIEDDTAIYDQIREKKGLIFNQFMGGELENLYQLFIALQLAEENELVKVQPGTLKTAIGKFLIECPVYRYYGNNLPLSQEEEETIEDIFKNIKKGNPELSSAIDLLTKTIIEKPKACSKDYNTKASHFYKRCMQFSGPLMAKGVEDTLMYTYNRFIGHNDVGDSPEAFGISVEDFHKKMIERRKHWPLSGNATSTHDTKRGEDVRARLNILSDIPEQWLTVVKDWQKMNAELKKNEMPYANDEYFIYQTLVGMHPLEKEEDVQERMEEYLRKALREGKINSEWGTPNEEYEQATIEFIAGLLDKQRTFWKSFESFLNKIIDYGIANSISQLILKFTTPGIPDVYQGTELWDFSLVDPDNRRPVDYEKRSNFLQQIESIDAGTLPEELWNSREDGKIKLWLTHLLLNERKAKPDLFTYGHYRPLQVKGKYKKNVIAFARQRKNTWYIIALPLHLAEVDKGSNLLDFDWKDTRIEMPEDAPNEWEILLTKEKTKKGTSIKVKDIFQPLPFAILKLEEKPTERGAGILLSITSLPSTYGVGDIGPEAQAFADILNKCRQKYWQLLPLNPTGKENGYSPYSSISSMACYPLLISPDLMVKAGLIDAREAKKLQLPAKEHTDYEAAEKIKSKLFDLAYNRFKDGKFSALGHQFEEFCKKEAYWLDDFALFVMLKQEMDNKPWYEWPEQYKMRNEDALEEFRQKHTDKINKQKWLQLLFLLQWKELKSYCNNRDIKLFGDLPFYVSYDSVDVWSHPEIFRLDENRNVTHVAGVPPDYFSEDGQLWGMPTFKWDVLKENGYSWWICRLKRNLELYDLVRIDHFRAFAEYWEVAAEEKTAKTGEWLPGPGKEFFDIVQKEIGSLPFVAEDLGDNMDKVYALRDEIGLPGMKVLQFAFGENMPFCVDIPHNYTHNCIVYTGTHDNNTTLGWYQHEANKADHKRMELYIDDKLREKDVHLIMSRLAYSSIANIAILPMQDILGLEEKYRMNMPGKGEGNWVWRLKPGQADQEIIKRLRRWIKLYNRG
jgi:malto-oligosyltrehalose synthase/4-alpha-glucanotransferase